jgi:hypothetical protein
MRTPRRLKEASVGTTQPKYFYNEISGTYYRLDLIKEVKTGGKVSDHPNHLLSSYSKTRIYEIYGYTEAHFTDESPIVKVKFMDGGEVILRVDNSEGYRTLHTWLTSK